jgi:hypothetical protein
LRRRSGETDTVYTKDFGKLGKEYASALIKQLKKGKVIGKARNDAPRAHSNLTELGTSRKPEPPVKTHSFGLTNCDADWRLINKPPG